MNRDLRVDESALHPCHKIYKLINFKVRKNYWLLVIWLLWAHGAGPSVMAYFYLAPGRQDLFLPEERKLKRRG